MSVDEASPRVIIHETHQDPSQVGKVSFPTRAEAGTTTRTTTPKSSRRKARPRAKSPSSRASTRTIASPSNHGGRAHGRQESEGVRQAEEAESRQERGGEEEVGERQFAALGTRIRP
jgi:hypothetical protein